VTAGCEVLRLFQDIEEVLGTQLLESGDSFDPCTCTSLDHEIPRIGNMAFRWKYLECCCAAYLEYVQDPFEDCCN
jgi:hypothetical protein